MGRGFCYRCGGWCSGAHRRITISSGDVRSPVEGDADMARVVADCRDMPSESGCTLTIAGEPDEVLDAATAHAVASHGHDESPEQ